MKTKAAGTTWLGLAVVAVVLVLAPPARASSWPEFNLNGQHTGTSLQETTIHTGNVATLHVRAGFPVTLPSLALDGSPASIADGAPALLQDVPTASGSVDILFLTGRGGRIMALNAATGATIWSHRPATGPQYTTSSPAVDPNHQFVYSYGLEGRVHKYMVADGTEVTTGGWPELATLKPTVEKQSSALSLATTNGGTSYLYVSNGGYPGDAGDYQGHVTAINLTTGVQNVFNTMCSDQTVHFVTGGSPDCTGGVQSAVWARAGVVYDPDNDKIFFGTGNGTYNAQNANPANTFWGDSILALHPDGTGAGGRLPVDSYTPTEFQFLQNTDADLGSTAPAILPTPATSNIAHLAAQSGKDGMIRLLNLDDLSGMGGPGHVSGEIQKIGVPQGAEVLTALAVWVDPADGSTWFFVANGNGISGLKLSVDGLGNPSIASPWFHGSGGSSPVVANGILYHVGGNNVYALDPTTGNQLFHDTAIGGIHWESPIVINGRLYVTDEASKLWAYEPNAAPLGYFTVTPCRAIDTRGANGPFGGPALAAGASRTFALAGQCGVPADALAVAANVTVVSPAAAGFLQVAPGNAVLPTSVLNFVGGDLRANNAVVSLTGNPVGSLTVTDASSGSANVLIDITGYFK
ncbi:MAG TPA: PQQ-binding-like beta-propeller repeat protein [Thermoanaerobaculia bacterium]|nr:PQQ-binding-like beta-propeller repeat protein [Thermoanaerobaculia bacterium]